MTEFFVLEPVAVNEQGRRVPDDLPLETPNARSSRMLLRELGYAIASIDADAAAPASPAALLTKRSCVPPWRPG